MDNEVAKKENMLPEEYVYPYEIRDSKGKVSINDKIDVSGMLNKIFQFVNVNDIASNVKKGSEYIVQIPKEFQPMVDSGEYWIMKNQKTGVEWPNLVKLGENGKNEIVKPLSVKREEFIKGNPTKELTNYYQNMYLQNQMQQNAIMLETAIQEIRRIEQGLKNDRIALIKAGQEQVSLALMQKDDATRRTAIQDGINNIILGKNQVYEQLKSYTEDFQPLPKHMLVRFFKEFKKSGYLVDKDKDYNNIVEYYDLYLEATKLLSLSYLAVDDKDNAKRVFEIAQNQLMQIDFSNTKTISYIHDSESFLPFSESITEELSDERKLCIEHTENYKSVAIQISGDKLLEIIENEKEK